MALTIKLKGKRRAVECIKFDPSLAPQSTSEPPHPTKRVRRAETRQCPVCKERIPLRLLAMHAQLESQRVEEVVKKVGSSELSYDEMVDDSLSGPSSRVRRSAVRARKSIASTHNIKDSIEQSNKTIMAIKRRRKQRSQKLKESLKEEEGSVAQDSWSRRFSGEEITCPLCSETVRGDQGVLEAHVDSCLAWETQRLQEARERELTHRHALAEETWDTTDDQTNYVGDLRGAGFHRRNDEECLEEDVDIDGDDQAMFGQVQFTESDVVPVNEGMHDIDEDVDPDDLQETQKTIRDLIAAGKRMLPLVPKTSDVYHSSEVDKIELAILRAQQCGDNVSLVSALEDKIRLLQESVPSATTALLCRICIDSYTEPTVSTGCWHTCCKECWLRCLGSTKLCPICKRITGASDLRRVYL